MESSMGHRFGPADDLKCVWMTAGILTYHLCDLNFDCDHCPLDGAMRKDALNSPASRAGHTERIPQPQAPEPLRADHIYARNHCWVHATGPDHLRIGLEPGLSWALLTPKAIVCPSPGQQVHKGQTCLWIVLDNGTLPVEAPCEGMVHLVNPLLSSYPHLLNLKPFEDGWLYELVVGAGSMQRERFMNAAAAEVYYRESQSRLIKLLTNALRSSRPGAVHALTEGTFRLQEIADTLGADKYFQIVRKVYGAEFQAPGRAGERHIRE